MGSVAQHVRLAAPPAEVWAFITDHANFPAYVDGYETGTASPSGAPGVGTEYVWTGRLGPLRPKSTERIVQWRDGERVAYTGRLAGVPFDSSMEVHGDGEGGTVLAIAIRYRVPRRFGGSLTDRLFARRVVRGSVARSAERLVRQFGGSHQGSVRSSHS